MLESFPLGSSFLDYVELIVAPKLLINSSSFPGYIYINVNANTQGIGDFCSVGNPFGHGRTPPIFELGDKP